MKVYIKRGNLNYREKKYIAAIEKSLAEKGITGNFTPAENFDDLKRLHDEYCSEDATIISETKKEVSSEPTKLFDPLNDDNVIVRDYVIGASSKEKAKTDPTFFEEPSEDAKFELPPDGADDEINNQSSNEQGDNKDASRGKQNNSNGASKSKPEPANPSFNEMSSSAKRKSTKRLATAIVHGVCALSEFGCNWYVTKDITQDKIAEYDLQGNMDLELLLTLDDSQQVTVREWFAIQVKNSSDILRVSEEGKAEMIESLYVVLMEKGVALTPTQEVMLSFGVHVVLDLGMKSFAMGQQIKGVLNQLVAMQNERKAEQQQQQPNQNTVEEPIVARDKNFENEIVTSSQEAQNDKELTELLELNK
jgi:hypothetical protein